MGENGSKTAIKVTPVFQAWFEGLSRKEQDKITAVTEILQEKGANLPYPFSSGISLSKFGHMRELRVQAGGNPVRIFYALDPNRDAIMLVGGLKTGSKDKKFYQTYVAKADKLYEEHLKSLSAAAKPKMQR
jgi:hypothetical protein